MKDSLVLFAQKYITPVGASLLAVLAPIQSILLVTEFLIVADLLSGVLAAKKRGETITSAGLRRTATKFLVYNLAIISGFLVEQYMLASIFPVSKLISGVIALTELKSLLENLNSINGVDLFKTIIGSLGSKNDEIKKEIVTDIKEIEEGDSKEPPKT